MRRAALALLVLAAFVACDELNRPMNHPKSEPRRRCFSEVECPSYLKCHKGPQDIEGYCIPRDAGVEDDAEAAPIDEAGAPAPMPTITPQPGDIQI